MAELVNVRQVRKLRARADKERLAAENRAAHGRSKGKKEAAANARAKALATVEGHRREDRKDGAD